MFKKVKSARGFSLVELLFTFSILAFTLCGILLTYIQMFLLSDLARDTTYATNAVQAKMEEIKNTAFDSISLYNDTAFDIPGFAAEDAKGRVEVYSTAYADLYRVRVMASFKSRKRLIGEDANLNGEFNTGEDANGNDRLDPAVELVTLISR